MAHERPELRGPAGRLEALYTPGSANAQYAAVICHPHPLFGGTMHNKVVYHAAKVFEAGGTGVLRFNFRGAGASEGAHDRGEGEQQDLAAAMAWLSRRTGLPLVVAGFSFGAFVALRTCCAPGGAPGEVLGLVALGLPIEAGDRAYGYEFLARCRLPKLFVSGSADQFGPVPAVEAAAGLAAGVAELAWVEGADHFFQRAVGSPSGVSGLGEMQAAIRAWLDRHLSGTASAATQAAEGAR